MAVVVSHAMRRYPTSPPGSSYSSHCLGGEGAYQDTWSRDELSESALSRSMRYAEPWLYGSVRAPGGLLLAPALVLCSCSEYLSGTKRSSKKGPTLCKKCKGTRLPLPSADTLRGSPKFGTVRCYPTAPTMGATSPPARSGTVRVNSHSRPSILPTADPYELMRRSRLSPENGTQFRLRATSPHGEPKASRKAPKAPSGGRKSILECDINPYDLMSVEGDAKGAKDSSITLVGGQRVRVRPHAEQEYEEIKVQSRPPSQIPKLKGSPSATKGPAKSNEKESDASRFKSILKKPTTFSDTDSSGGPERSPSPALRSGSHFYLPMPMSAPRKKVQFLVENELVCQGDRKGEPRIEKPDDVLLEEANIYEEVPECVEEAPEKKSLTLRRSVSERLTQESTKVVFHDTMALRTRNRRNDSRRAFDVITDFQRLDGVSYRARSISPVRRRAPKSPPPPPPTADEELQAHEVSSSNPTGRKPEPEPVRGENVTKSEDIPLYKQEPVKSERGVRNRETTTSGRGEKDKSRKREEKASKLEVKNNHKLETKSKANVGFDITKEEEIVLKSGEKNNVKSQVSTNSETEEVAAKKEVKSCDKIEVKPFADTAKTIKENVPSIIEAKNDGQLHTVISRDTVKRINVNCTEVEVKNDSKPEIKPQTIVSSDPTNKSKESVSEINLQKEEVKPQVADNFDTPPAVPPRKRSNGKQPSIVTIEPSTTLKPGFQTLKIGSPSSPSTPSFDYQNKTVVQIRAPPAVHKIQIKNEFLESNTNVQTVVVSDNTQRKTSIMINGDDCYSTINVNDDVPMYQSSVVVKDVGMEKDIKLNRSSSIYITGNFVTHASDSLTVPTTNKQSFESPKYNAVALSPTPPEKFNELPTKDHQEPPIRSNGSPKAQRKKEIPPAEDLTLPTPACPPPKRCPASSEELRQLLKDPVEAVKRNLVPHVCGRSDVSRRPRDKKLNNFTASLLEDRVETNITKLIENSLLKLRNYEFLEDDDKDLCSEHSSSTQYETMDPGSDCYTDNSNRSSVTEEELNARTKFYEMLADSAIAEISENEDHHYESIRLNSDPIYEEISPPPLPSNPPPSSIIDDLQLDKQFTTRSIFEGASKYDILSYLVDAKERGIIPEDSYNFGTSDVVIEEDGKEAAEQFRVSHISSVSDSSEESSLVITNGLSDDKSSFPKAAEVERNDSGVGSETSKSSLSRFRAKSEPSMNCEDCEAQVETQTENEPLICRKCFKKRSERKEIITEIVETEEKYSRDLQIILEEFYQPMLVAGLLTPEQLAAIFLNVEELLENSQALAERLRDAVEIAIEQGDEDLLTVNIGKLFLEAAPMLHGFETYCIRQGNASLLLASLEKEKELLRIFLRVSQMENTMLRRMNLNSFLMVPVQRVTKYPLLLTRLYKATPVHHETRDQLKDAQHKIELHLNHMNSETKDVPSKLWRRIGSNSGRRSSSEMDLVSIKLRKIAVDVLEWNHDEAKFILEGKLLFTQPTDNNWRKGRTIKLAPINALLVTNGKQMFGNRTEDGGLTFPKNGVREAALLLVRDKNGRYSLLREPLYLDRCIIATDPAWQSYFEVQEVIGKDTFIFKAEDDDLTRMWYRQLQYHAQGLGGWRKRRNALANIMINGMGLRS